jgi:hypothetical protein
MDRTENTVSSGSFIVACIFMLLSNARGDAQTDNMATSFYFIKNKESRLFYNGYLKVQCNICTLDFEMTEPTQKTCITRFCKINSYFVYIHLWWVNNLRNEQKTR